METCGTDVVFPVIMGEFAQGGKLIKCEADCPQCTINMLFSTERLEGTRDLICENCGKAFTVTFVKVYESFYEKYSQLQEKWKKGE